MKKYLLALLTLCLMLACTAALADSDGDWTYSVDRKGVATLTGYTGSETKITLPETLGGYPITCVGNKAFQNNTAIKQVIIPDCYTTIGARAFEGCTRISYVRLGSGITTWKEDWSYGGAFAGCVNLFEVDFTPGITCIGQAAFKGCTLLDAIELPSTVTYVGKNAFENCELLDIVEVYGDIDNQAFKNCAYMSDLTIHNASYLGSQAFYGCTSLKEVELPETLVSIYGEAFRGCSKLRRIDLPGNLNLLAYRAFADCLQLKAMTINSAITEWPEDWSSSYVFSNCPVLVDVTINPGVTRLPNNFFRDCRSLAHVTLPEGLITMDKEIFVGCSALESVTLPSTLQTIGSNCFDSCAALTEAKLPESLVSIGYKAFYGTSLTEVVIPNKVTDIGAYAFCNCSKLTDVTLGEYVTTWHNDWGHNGAFENCTSLRSLTILDGVNSIGTYAFRNCTSLESVEIPSTSIRVGEHAFNGCKALKEAVIYRGEIENDAFNGCSALESISIRKVTSIGSGAFANCTVLTGVELPRTLLTLGAYAFDNCPGLTEITVPDSTTFFGAYAFRNCVNLKTAFIGNNINEWNRDWSRNSGFLGCTSLEYVYFENGMTSVPDTLLKNCTNLKGVYIPGTVGRIEGNAFEKVPTTCVIYGDAGSAAEQYANERGYAFSTGSFPWEY